MRNLRKGTETHVVEPRRNRADVRGVRSTVRRYAENWEQGEKKNEILHPLQIFISQSRALPPRNPRLHPRLNILRCLARIFRRNEYGNGEEANEQRNVATITAEK